MTFGGVATQLGEEQPTDVVIVGQLQAGNQEPIDFGNGITFSNIGSQNYGFVVFYSDGLAQWATLGSGSTPSFGDSATAVTYADDVFVSFQTQPAVGTFTLSSIGCSPVPISAQPSLVVARLSAATGACVWIHGTTAATAGSILG